MTNNLNKTLESEYYTPLFKDIVRYVREEQYPIEDSELSRINNLLRGHYISTKDGLITALKYRRIKRLGEKTKKFLIAYLNNEPCVDINKKNEALQEIRKLERRIAKLKKEYGID